MSALIRSRSDETRRLALRSGVYRDAQGCTDTRGVRAAARRGCTEARADGPRRAGVRARRYPQTRSEWAADAASVEPDGAVYQGARAEARHGSARAAIGGRFGRAPMAVATAGVYQDARAVLQGDRVGRPTGCTKARGLGWLALAEPRRIGSTTGASPPAEGCTSARASVRAETYAAAICRGPRSWEKD